MHKNPLKCIKLSAIILTKSITRATRGKEVKMDIETMIAETEYYLAQAKTKEEIQKWADALAHLELIVKGVK